MAGMKGITVNTTPEAEPHIYAEDDAAIYKAIFGGDGVSTIGQACKATVLSNNKVRIADGVLCVDGHMARIPYGEYEDCEIMNGQSGKNRNDIIVAKFETTGTGGIDTMTCEAIQGIAGEMAVDPELTQDDIYAGGKVREYPLYRVKIEGLSITAVEQMFRIIPSNKDLSNKVAELNKNIACSPSVKRRETLISFQKNVKHKIEHTGQIQFAAAFSSTAGYCRFYVYNSSGEIVYREQLNPAPVPANEVTTGQLQVYDGWEFLAESYNALAANTPKYTLTY